MDRRVTYWLAAEEQIRESQKHKYTTLGFWVNLAVALVNAAMAALPDSVIDEVEIEMARRLRMQQKLQKKVQKKVTEDLHGK